MCWKFSLYIDYDVFVIWKWFIFILSYVKNKWNKWNRVEKLFCTTSAQWHRLLAQHFLSFVFSFSRDVLYLLPRHPQRFFGNSNRAALLGHSRKYVHFLHLQPIFSFHCLTRPRPPPSAHRRKNTHTPRRRDRCNISFSIFSFLRVRFSSFSLQLQIMLI